MRKAWLTVLAACLPIAGHDAANADGLAISVQAPVLPAMPQGLDCVRSRLSPAQWRDFTALAVGQGGREDPRAQPVLQAVEACGDQLAWSPEKRRRAGMFTMSVAGAMGVRELLAAQGIRIEQLDPAILADRDLVAAAERDALDSGVGEAFATRHFDEFERIAGGRSLDGNLGVRFGNYIAFRVLIETTARQFARAP